MFVGKYHKLVYIGKSFPFNTRLNHEKVAKEMTEFCQKTARFQPWRIFSGPVIASDPADRHMVAPKKKVPEMATDN